MTIFYNDPYKDNKFGKLKGDKRTEYLKVTFNEARFYKHDSAYILAGNFTTFGGVVRSYKPELPLEAGLVELPIYGDSYELRQKKPGTGTNGTKSEYETITLAPSIAEKLLHDYIENNSRVYLPDNKAIKGSLTLYPDTEYIDKNDAQKLEHVLANTSLEEIDISGTYPEWIAPKAYNKNSYSSYNKGISLDEKVAFLKKELGEAISEQVYKESDSLPLAAYVHKVLDDNSTNERFIVCYFDLLKSLVD